MGAVQTYSSGEGASENSSKIPVLLLPWHASRVLLVIAVAIAVRVTVAVASGVVVVARVDNPDPHLPWCQTGVEKPYPYIENMLLS